jgi:pilus assembly protein CpaB
VSRRRRAAVLLGLALVLGGLAASDVARREAAVRAQLGPAVEVVVARADLAAGRPVAAADLAVRRVPARYAPAGAATVPETLIGQRLAAPVPRGGYIGAALVATEPDVAGPPVGKGERAAEVVALGTRALVVPGARVDVLVTREGGATAGTELALENVEVLAARGAPAAARDEGGERVAATLRVSVRDAVYLAAAQSFARELRLLPRAAGDDERTGPITVGEGLR